MGAYIVYFLVGSVVAIPYLAYLLFRTRRDLSELRAELRSRGVIAAGRGPARAVVASPSDAARPLGSGEDAGQARRGRGAAAVSAPRDEG